MQKIILTVVLNLIVCSNTFTLIAAPATAEKITTQKPKSASKVSIPIFTPPADWQLVDKKSVPLPPRVQMLTVGKGPSAFPPSMNLSSEPYQGTLKQYLQIVKRMNEEKGDTWKDLGVINTKAGQASLSQVDNKSQWGDVRLMHLILLKNGTIYILTASALKSDFSLFYQDFFKAMRSFRMATDLSDLDQAQKELFASQSENKPENASSNTKIPSETVLDKYESKE